ncbi:ribonuclease T2 [Heterostelium album PN500]|uniref:Ribonuclease T2 n=1 Tax=Heterostelium pallidum (strain ATCC 26659 / Pp 5 / PN500) TaxID=670386 RepID=D3B803_HETP5|nr:ribonuclease T2 [Heterostelium album PN500]EFA82171.1 ribonuclease T2 [Heterostelium album PN500]|eukprot:XP_020434288.1 ribonuclease T2 [Heterostelium album PN500]
MKIFAALSLLFVLLAVSATSRSITIYEGGNPGQFDFYLFVQQWIYSYCGQQTCIASKEREAFTIHGLWPENSDGSYPSFCKGPSFSSSAIQDLMNQLNYDWPSLTGPNTDFWTHEWSKHGTCSLTGPITNIHDYFAAGLKVYNAYNISSSLADHGIVPSNTQSYSITSITNALINSLGNTPLLQCQNGQLSTVALCITKDLELMDCPALDGWSCSGSTIIPSTD